MKRFLLSSLTVLVAVLGLALHAAQPSAVGAATPPNCSQYEAVRYLGPYCSYTEAARVARYIQDYYDYQADVVYRNGYWYVKVYVG